MRTSRRSTLRRPPFQFVCRPSDPPASYFHWQENRKKHLQILREFAAVDDNRYHLPSEDKCAKGLGTQFGLARILQFNYGMKIKRMQPRSWTQHPPNMDDVDESLREMTIPISTLPRPWRCLLVVLLIKFQLWSRHFFFTQGSLGVPSICVVQTLSCRKQWTSTLVHLLRPEIKKMHEFRNQTREAQVELNWSIRWRNTRPPDWRSHGR